MSRNRRRADAPREIEVGPVAALVGLAVLVALGAGAWWLVGPGRAPAPPTAAPTAAAPGAATFTTPEGEPGLGSPSAPVTIEAFEDFQCPNCRQFATDVMPWLRQSWIAQGFVKVIWHDFAIRGLESVRAAEAARCAAEQGRFWEMHDRLYEAQSGENKGAFADDRLRALAAEVGLDAAAFDACLASGRYRAAIEASTRAAAARGFEGTPTFLVNGREVQGFVEAARWDELFRLYQRDFASATAGAGG